MQDDYIDYCLFVYRITVSRTLNDSPFFLLYGRDPVLPNDLKFGVHNKGRQLLADENKNHQFKLVQRLKSAYDKLLKKKQGDQQKHKLYYDASHINY